MARPASYTRTYSFTNFEQNNPGQPKPGPSLDGEYDNVSLAITSTQNALALIQRDDGALINGSVGEDQLVPGLFDHVADSIIAQAQGYATQAAGSATQALTYAGQASTSATSAAASAASAAGASAQAVAAQGIAQNAANMADLSAEEADAAATTAQTAASDTAGSVAATQDAVDKAYKWAEYLAGSVEPAPPNYPEAVDDGMFSSKWWALRARDFNATAEIELGSGQANIGAAFVAWDAVDGNDLPLGQIYANWGTPPLVYVLTDHGHPELAASWTRITGADGPPGPANVLTPGTITTGAPGSAAVVTITGVSPNQVLNMTIPRGDVGAQGIQGIQGIQGVAGPANTLAIGTVTTGAAGSAATATITGTAPNQTLSMSIPQGLQGIQGIQGVAGPSGSVANPSVLIGLTAKNGVAITAIRSDGASALDQAIAPTWTGPHVFSTTTRFVSALSSGAQIGLTNTAAGAGTQNTILRINNTGSLVISSAADATPDTAVTAGFQMTRSASAWTTLFFGNATDNPAYSFLGGGLTTLGGNVNVRGGFLLLGTISAGYVAVSDLADGFLRLNGSSNYANGVYTPGPARVDGTLTFQTQLSNISGANTLTWNTGGMPYGSVYVAGAYGNYMGYGINDVLKVCLISNGTDGGIVIAGDSKWLIHRASGTQADSGYNLTALSFNSNSSRALKRETGKPSRVADMLARLRPILYRLLEGDDSEQLGLIAEEVHEVCPQLSNGKTVSYDRLALLLLADWQETRAPDYASMR